MKELIEQSSRETRPSVLTQYLDALKPLALILGAAVIIFALFLALGPYGGSDIIDALRRPSFSVLTSLFSNAGGEIMLGLLGIVITMVAITVELAAQRYTPRVIELFVKDKLHITALVILAVTSITIVIVLFFSRDREPLPGFMISLAFFLMIFSLVAIVPYIIYVFKFLDPSNIISKIEREIMRDARKGMPSGVTVQRRHFQRQMVQGIDQLTDISLNSIDKMDRVLATVSIKSLRNFAINYISHKVSGGAAEAWFTPGDTLRYNNADFVAIDQATFARLVENRIWVEYKVMKQFEHVFRHSLHGSKDICNFISQCLLMLGSHAANLGDHRIIELVIFYFNTLLRATLNDRDNRTCFNMLNHYRMLAENLVEAGEEQFVIDIATYFKYYGTLANETMDMPFILETVAHDLCDLDKKAFVKNLRCHNDLLDIILKVDVPLEGDREKKSLRGIRKAQILLALYYLDIMEEKAQGDFRKIYWDIVEEIDRKGGFERIMSIIKELKYVKEEYWEIIERRLNLDYLPPQLKPHLLRILDLFTIRHVLFFAYYRHCSRNDSAEGILGDFMMALESEPEDVPMDMREYEEYYGAGGLDSRENLFRQIMDTAQCLHDESALSLYLRQFLPAEVAAAATPADYLLLVNRFYVEFEAAYRRQFGG